LIVRLFLPSAWLRDGDRVKATGVPVSFHEPVRKAAIALEMIDLVRNEGWPAAPVVADPAFATLAEFSDGLTERRLLAETDLKTQERLLRVSNEQFNFMRSDLGLDHYEGRSWRGWHHHVSLVLLAYAYRRIARNASSPAINSIQMA
jgi:SRSO17 transposase